MIKRLKIPILIITVLTAVIVSVIFTVYRLRPGLLDITVVSESDEQRGAADSKTIKIVYFNSLTPYSWEDSEGRATGILIDILDAILRDKMNYTVIHEALPWERAQKRVLHGDADAFCTLITPTRLAYSTPTMLPVITLRTEVSVSPKNPRLDSILLVETISDLKPFKIAAYRGYGFLNKYPDFDYVLSNDSLSAVKMVASNRADIYVGVREHLRSLIKRTGAELITFPFKGAPEVDFHFMIGNHYPSDTIHSEFDKALAQLKEEGVYQLILEKY